MPRANGSGCERSEEGRAISCAPVLQGPTELVFDLHPTATVFDAGHWIRVTLMGADADNAQVLPTARGTVLRVFRDAVHSSAIELPILE